MADLPYWLNLLIYQIPALLVALVGVILSLTNMRRCSGAATMTLIGCGLLGLGSVVFLLVRVMLWQEMREGNMPNKRYSELLMLVGIGSSLTFGLALALIVIAVFTGRNSQPKPRSDAAY